VVVIEQSRRFCFSTGNLFPLCGDFFKRRIGSQVGLLLSGYCSQDYNDVLSPTVTVAFISVLLAQILRRELKVNL